MDWDRIKGNWKQYQGRAREKWGELTDDELTRVAGQREQFEGLLQKKYGKTKDDVRKDVDRWLDTL